MKHTKFIKWTVASIGTFFGLIGAVDFVLTNAMNSAYFTQIGYGPEQIAYFVDYPFILKIIWGLAVVSMVLGSTFVVLLPRFAFVTLLTSVIAQLVLSGITFALRSRWEMLGATSAIQTFLLLIGTLIMAIVSRNLWLNQQKANKLN